MTRYDPERVCWNLVTMSGDGRQSMSDRASGDGSCTTEPYYGDSRERWDGFSMWFGQYGTVRGDGDGNGEGR